MTKTLQKPQKSRELSLPSAKLEKRRTALASDSEQLAKEARSATAATTRVGNAEARYKSEYARMLKYNSELIRRMNLQLAKSLTSRDIYALSTLMSQQREVINDLRSIADMSQQVGLIYEHALTPLVGDLTQLVTDVYYQMRKLLMETSKPKDTQFALSQLDDLVKQIGLGLHTSHGVARKAVEQILLGPAPKAQKKR